MGWRFEYLIKWNPRRQDKAAWVEQAEAAGAFMETRPGQREALMSCVVVQRWQKQTRPLRRVVGVLGPHASSTPAHRKGGLGGHQTFHIEAEANAPVPSEPGHYHAFAITTINISDFDSRILYEKLMPNLNRTQRHGKTDPS